MRLIPVFFLLFIAGSAFARLGDTREQAEGRYGLPKSEKPPTHARPLLERARELTFEYEGWSIRCALLLAKDGQEYVVREEYTRKTGSGTPTIKDFEREAILQGESNGMKWRPGASAGVPREAFSKWVGSDWVRDDGATAVHGLGGFPLRMQLPQAWKYEAELKGIAQQKNQTGLHQVLQRNERAETALRKVDAQQPSPFSKGRLLMFGIFIGLCLVAKELLRSKRKRKPKEESSVGVAPPPFPPGSPAVDWIPKADPKSVKNLPWDEFELVVGEIYRRQGFSVELSAGTGADGGIDLTLTKDGQKILVQCKSWNAYKVNVSEIREFFGVLVSEQANRGIFVTTGQFTRDALEFASGKPIEMIDGPRLEGLIQEAAAGPDDDLLNVGLWAPVFLNAAKVTWPACPYCKIKMAKRTGPSGAFWGCSTYPKCRGKREMRRHVENSALVEV